VFVGLELPGAVDRAVVERAMGAKVSVDRLPQDIGPVQVDRLVGLLRLVAVARQIAVAQARRDAVAVDGLDGRAADSDFAALVVRSDSVKPLTACLVAQ
jgi:hypothetical protein